METRTNPGQDLLEQITNITKAHAYDLVSQDNKSLREQNKQLIERVKFLENLIKEYTTKMLNNLK